MNIISDIRGVVVAIDCGTCDGKGAVYLTETAAHQTECPACHGVRTINTTVPLVDFVKKLIKDQERFGTE